MRFSASGLGISLHNARNVLALGSLIIPSLSAVPAFPRFHFATLEACTFYLLVVLLPRAAVFQA